jgi:hypothetical protein
LRLRIPLLAVVGALALCGLGASAASASTTRYVSTSGTDNATCDSANPCRTVQHAVDVAGPGDTVRIAAGTYTEQVLIAKNLTVLGAGIDSTTIKGPDVKTFDAFGKTYIVETTSGATVNVAGLTVSGPSGPGGGLDCAPNSLSLDMGVAVVNNSTLNMFNAAVRKIYDIDPVGAKNSGCQRGDAVSIGKPGGIGVPLTTGHANLAGVVVNDYQKDGVAARTAGTTLNQAYTQVVNQPSSVIASNGIEVLDGAAGQIRRNSVTGNECNLAVYCGPDPFNNTEASGILSFAADPSTTIAENQVSANDMGVYTDDGIRIADNQINDNRATGIYVDTDATKLHATQNTTNRDGYYGIAIGPAFPPDFPTPNPGGNFFIGNTAFGNTKYDLYQAPGSGPNVNRNNRCATAFPSRTYWDCRSNGGGERDDSPGGGPRHGHHGDGGPANRND